MNGIIVYDKIVESEKTETGNLSDSYWSNLADDAAIRAEHSGDYLETEG